MNNTTEIYQTVYAQVNWYYSARCWLSFGLIGVVTNILEVSTICYKKKYKSIFGMTMLSLSISDVLSSLCFLVVGLMRIIEYDGNSLLSIIPGTKRAVAWQGGHGALFFAMGTSFIHIIFIAVQRFFAVFMPLRYMSSFHSKHCLILLICIWLLFFAGGVIGYFYLKEIWYVSYILTLAVNLTLVLCYTAIVVKNFRAERNRRRLLGERYDVTKVRSTASKVLRVSVAVTGAFFLCTCPHAIFYLFVNKYWIYYHTVNSMISINPFLDSLFYFAFYYRGDSTKNKKGLNSKPTKSKESLATIEKDGISPANTPNSGRYIMEGNRKTAPKSHLGIALKRL